MTIILSWVFGTLLTVFFFLLIVFAIVGLIDQIIQIIRG